MPILRCSDQSDKTLEEFYIKVSSWGRQFVDIGKKMLLFVELVNNTFEETQLWAHTSHTRLVIQNKDMTYSEGLVTVQNAGIDEYYFSYKLPERKRAWRNAIVHGGVASNFSEATKYLLIAMRESEGWEGNLEFERLLKENELTQNSLE